MRYLKTWLPLNDAKALLDAIALSNPVRAIRINRIKCDEESILPYIKENFVGRSPYCEQSLLMNDRFSYGKHPFHHAGLYYIQEPSASLAGCLTKDYLGKKVLDLCAAPGGKSTHIAQYLSRDAILFSNEIDYARAKILASNIERLGIKNAVVTSNSPAVLAEIYGEYFDNVLVDAPCSGEGMMRKNEQAILNWSLENVTACAQRQLQILESAYALVNAGGYITYSTCTFNPIENENVILEFLKRHPDLSTAEPKIELKNIADVGGFGLDNGVRVFPGKHAGEGHFICMIRKNESRKNMSPHFLHRKEEQPLSAFENETITAIMHALFQNAENLFTGNFKRFNETIISPAVASLPEKLNIVKNGVSLACVLPSKRIIPHHNAVTCSDTNSLNNKFNMRIDDLPIAKYLHGEELSDDSCAFEGWGIACVENYPLGLIKAVGGQIKNHYPKGLRNLK